MDKEEETKKEKKDIKTTARQPNLDHLPMRKIKAIPFYPEKDENES